MVFPTVTVAHVGLNHQLSLKMNNIRLIVAENVSVNAPKEMRRQKLVRPALFCLAFCIIVTIK